MIELNHKQKENIGLQYVLDLMAPCSAYGQEALRKLRPYSRAQKDELQCELDNVEKAIVSRQKQEADYVRLEQVLRQVKNITKTIQSIEDGMLGEVDLFELKRYLLQLADIVPLYDAVNESAQYNDIAFADTSAALEILDPEKNRVASFHISNRYSEELTRIRREKKLTEEALRKEADKKQKEILMARRSELVTQEQREEEAVRRSLAGQLLPYKELMLQNARAIARLDIVMQKAVLAKRMQCCKPEIGTKILMKEMYNPRIAAILEKEGRSFTPVSIELDTGTTVITGANMGGKSVALKTIALNVALVQYGFYAFADRAETPLFDAMYIVSEDLEAVDRGLSTFGGEIVRLNEITASLKTKFPIILLDEFARGTNPDEGAAIARAVAEYLNSREAVTVMTTHYDGVADVARAHYQVAGLSGADMGKLKAELESASRADRVSVIARHMDYGLFPVEGSRRVSRDAISICHLLKCDKEILNLVENNY